MRCWYRAVMSDARVGLHTGPVSYPSVKRIPALAIESICGVGMSLDP